MDKHQDSQANEQDSSHAPATTTDPIESKHVKPLIPDAPSAIKNIETEKAHIHNDGTESQPTISETSDKLLLDRIKRSDRWMIGLTAVLAVTGILGWLVTWEQLGVLKGQLGEMVTGGTQTEKVITAMNRIASSMEESAKQSKTALDYTIEKSQLDQRAWVMVSRAVIHVPIVAGKSSDITITLKNSGKSPALKTRFRQSAKLVSQLPIGSMPKVPSNKPVESVSAIGPDGTAVNHFTLLPLPEWQVSLLNSGKALIVTFGQITYFDIFNIKHDTTFCFFQQEIAKPELSPCERLNDAN